MSYPVTHFSRWDCIQFLTVAASPWESSTPLCQLWLGTHPEHTRSFSIFPYETCYGDSERKTCRISQQQDSPRTLRGVSTLKRTSSDRNSESETIHQRDPHSGKLAGKVKDELPWVWKEKTKREESDSSFWRYKVFYRHKANRNL